MSSIRAAASPWPQAADVLTSGGDACFCRLAVNADSTVLEQVPKRLD